MRGNAVLTLICALALTLIWPAPSFSAGAPPDVVFGGCGFASESKSQRQPSPRAQARIQKEVRHQLLMLPYLGVFDNLVYQVDGYNVTLGGAVTNPTLKSDAERSVKRIEGVEKVTNRIDVLPPSSMDDGLRRQLYRAIYGYPSLQKYALIPIKPIRIIVRNGQVALEGVVDSQSDKNTAYIRASGVPGTFSVKNNLVVSK